MAIGHAIVSLDRFFHLIGDQGPIVAFVSAQLDNPRPATRRNAAAFLKGHCPGAALTVKEGAFPSPARELTGYKRLPS